MKRKKIKNLVVAVDLSDHSRSVVKQAQEMARNLKMNLVFVYVFEDIAVFDEAFDVKKRKISDYYTEKIKKEYAFSKKDLVIVRYRSLD